MLIIRYCFVFWLMYWRVPTWLWFLGREWMGLCVVRWLGFLLLAASRTCLTLTCFESDLCVSYHHMRCNPFSGGSMVAYLPSSVPSTHERSVITWDLTLSRGSLVGNVSIIIPSSVLSAPESKVLPSRTIEPYATRTAKHQNLSKSWHGGSFHFIIWGIVYCV